MRLRTFVFPVAAGLILASAAPLTAQDAPTPSGSAQGTPANPAAEQARPGPPVRAQLVFEREVFDYPSFQRRNPFRPLLADQTGPRFENMALAGILYVDDNPPSSVAILSSNTVADQAAATRRLRIGQSWGNVRVLAIRRAEVVVEVAEFGATEQRIMRLPTRGQGGS